MYISNIQCLWNISVTTQVILSVNNSPKPAIKKKKKKNNFQQDAYKDSQKVQQF